MIRRHRSLIVPLILGVVWLLLPDLVYADNCSSLNDCYYTLRAALAAAVGLGVFSALMAIGLDVGPFAGSLKKRPGGLKDEGDAAGAAGAADLATAEIDAWNRSLGVVSVSGLVTSPASTTAAPPTAAKPAPGPRQATAPETPTTDRTADAMRDAPPEARAANRTPDTMRETAPQTGQGRRAPEYDLQQPPSAEPAPDAPGVADRAEQATQIAGEPSDAAGARDMSTQAQAPGAESPPGAAGEEGPRAFDQGQRAKSMPDQAPGASEQGRPPADVSEAPRMRQAAGDTPSDAPQVDHMDQAAPRADRAPDHVRGDLPDAPGRRGEPSISPPPSGEPPADAGGEGVADRAQDVTDAFEPAGDRRMAQAEPPPDEQMAQARRPPPPESEGMAQADAPGSSAPQSDVSQAGRPSPPQAAKPAGADQAGSAGAEGASTQGSPPPQVEPAAAGQAATPGSAAQAPFAQAAQDLASAYSDLSRVPGMRLLLQQVAFHGRWAAHAAAAQLTIARRLGQHGAELAGLAHRGRGADILIEGGPAIEVKDYYWRGPFFQNEENVAAATRRLVRQVELLRRRYPQREVQLAFSDPRHVPRQMRIVLQSVGVELAPGVEATAGAPADVADPSLIERLRHSTAEQYLLDLAACGWQIDDTGLQARVRDAFVLDPAGAWLACAVVAFDAESIYETNPLGESYAAHLGLLGLASGGAFRPENAAERVQGQTHQLRFTHDERRYEVATPSATDLVAQAFLDTVNRALAQSGALRRFWALPSPDQMLYLALVPEEVAQRAVEAGLVPGPQETGA